MKPLPRDPALDGLREGGGGRKRTARGLRDAGIQHPALRGPDRGALNPGPAHDGAQGELELDPQVLGAQAKVLRRQTRGEEFGDVERDRLGARAIGIPLDDVRRRRPEEQTHRDRRREAHDSEPAEQRDARQRRGSRPKLFSNAAPRSRTGRIDRYGCHNSARLRRPATSARGKPSPRPQAGPTHQGRLAPRISTCVIFTGSRGRSPAFGSRGMRAIRLTSSTESPSH